MTSTTAALPPSPAAEPPAAPRRRLRDAPSRLLHWLLAIGVVGAYATSEWDSARAVHALLGYGVVGVLVLRLLWGLVGPRSTRIGGLVTRVRAALKAGLRPEAGWTVRVGGAIALTGLGLLLLAAPATLSGVALLHSGWAGKWLEDVHEALGSALPLLALGHAAALAAAVALRGRQALSPMFSGTVPGPGPDVTPRNHLGVAVLCALVLTAFLWGQWDSVQTAVADTAAVGHERRHDDDDD
ncbi:cytochrome b/b6 domain-containing protein [Acidovorax lacteus]|uniref:Cytochrome b561 bacterial/Ni-hydrogenase domain-containing protein n=1 Tax=Acidovorax lacteus TaxID=1924988 RepID=A0ABP8L0W1_9BURK